MYGCFRKRLLMRVIEQAIPAPNEAGGGAEVV